MEEDELRIQISVLYAENIALKRVMSQRDAHIAFLEDQLGKQAKCKTQVENNGTAQAAARQKIAELQAQHANVIKRTTAAFIEQQNALVQQVSRMREEQEKLCLEKRSLEEQLDAAKARAIEAEQQNIRQQELRQEQLQRVLSEKMAGIARAGMKLDSEVEVLANQLDQERVEKVRLRADLMTARTSIDQMKSRVRNLEIQNAQLALQLKMVNVEQKTKLEAANKTIHELTREDNRTKALQAQAKALELEEQLTCLKRATSAAQIKAKFEAPVQGPTLKQKVFTQQKIPSASGRITQSSLLYKQAAQATAVVIQQNNSQRDMKQVQRLRFLVKHMDASKRESLLRSGLMGEVFNDVE